VRLGPAERGFGILHRGGERVLGREAVVCAQHMVTRMAAQEAADFIVRVQIAEHETAAMVVHEKRWCGGAVWISRRGIVPRRNRRRPARDLQVTHGADRRWPAADREDLAPEPGTRRSGRAGGKRPSLTARPEGEDELERWIERLPVNLDWRAT
jgi:hypothetical protein